MAEETTPLVASAPQPEMTTTTIHPAKEQLDYEQLLPYHILRDVILLSKSSSELQHTDNTVSRISQFQGGKLRSNISRCCTRLVTHSLSVGLRNISIFGLILLSFIEPPTWCRDFDDGDDNGYNGCAYALKLQGTPTFYSDDTETGTQDFYPNTGTVFLTLQQSLLLEWTFMICIASHTLLSIGRDGLSLRNYFAFSHSHQPTTHVDELTAKNLKVIRIVRLVRVTAIVLLIKGMLAFSILHNERPFAIFLRMILFITYSYGVLRELIVAVEVIPSMLSVSVVLLMVNVFYSLIGVAAFSGTKEGEEHFSNLIEAMWSLWTSMTTVIYPDVMMSAYNENRLSGLFFVSYMTITFFFLFNVILAIVVNAYKAKTEQREADIEKARIHNLTTAFYMLDRKSKGYITETQMMAVFLYLNEECEEISHIPQDQVNILFSILDQNKSDKLDLESFLNFGTVMLLQFESYSDYTPTLEYLFGLQKDEGYQKFRQFILSKCFEHFIDFVIILNTAVVLVQSYPELSGQTSGVAQNIKYYHNEMDMYWEYAEAAFTVVYTFEMTIKIIILGWKKYASMARNIFDGFITILAILATAYVYYPNSFNDPRLIRYIVMARVLRCARIFITFKPFEAMGKTFLGILPSVGRVAALLFCAVYMFSGIGMHFFGGLITRDPNNATSYLLEGTAFADCFYWGNNFNDLLSGMDVAFNLLVINNWNELESGILPVSQTKMCRWYFFSFYVCCVMIINNLVVGLIIDSFIDEMDEIESENNEAVVVRKDELIGGQHVLVDVGTLCGSKEETRKYVARFTKHTRSEGMMQKTLTNLIVSKVPHVQGDEHVIDFV